MFAALADPIRRAILRHLARGEATVGQLARPFGVSRPAVSKHLRVLERAGLVRRVRLGRESRCSLDSGRFREAAQWIASSRGSWEGQLDRLVEYLGWT